jgi:signal transduction histidine kinase
MSAPTSPGLNARLSEANARLIAAVVHAKNCLDDAHFETTQARRHARELLTRLEDTSAHLHAAAAQAETMAEQARAREEQYRQLSGRLLTLQDQERRRLARDLHDSVAQQLAAVIMHLDVVEASAPQLEAASRRSLSAGRALADRCARDVRTFAYLLHPPLLDEAGLLSALRWYVEGFIKRSGIPVELVTTDVGRMPTALETALFRVVQESLANVHRHASKASVLLRLARTRHTVALDVHDDGGGVRDMRPDARGTRQPPPLGVGIQGMRERIMQLGGTFDIIFSLDAGTTVRVRVPLAGDAE